MAKRYDMIIGGGGISGTATAFLASQYTDLNRIAVLEKYPTFAPLNSNSKSNSQTLHRGDIETNIGIDKAEGIRDAADMVVRYADKYLDPKETHDIIRTYPKMVLGVGNKEVRTLEGRLAKFQHIYPDFVQLDKKQIGEIEPKVAFTDPSRGIYREDEVTALFSDKGYTVNYGKLAETFMRQAQAVKGKDVHPYMETKINSIEKIDDGYKVHTNHGILEGDSVVVTAGAHSLMFAHEMGYGKDWGVLPVAGNFYWAKGEKLLNGKVYTVQNEKLPFAAIHGDPDINNERTRFGPTAKVLGVLERGNGIKTLFDFIKSVNLGWGYISTLGKEMMDKDVRSYIVRNNLTYELPIIGKHAFAQDARKIVPSLKASDLEFAKGIGGIRPQIVDKSHKKLLKGEAKIDEHDGIIFNMTPSPGATNCLKNAEMNIRSIVDFLGKDLYETDFQKDLKPRKVV